MDLRLHYVGDLIYYNFPSDWNKEKRHGWVFRPDKNQIKRWVDTSNLIIFGPGQDEPMEFLLKSPDIEVLFKSDKAVNTNYRAAGYPDPGLRRNTAIIFNFKGVE